MQKTIAVLWPSFLVAGIATILFSTFVDPDLFLAGMGLEDVSRLAIYSTAWLCFWIMGIITAVLTCYFLKPVE